MNIQIDKLTAKSKPRSIKSHKNYITHRTKFLGDDSLEALLTNYLKEYINSMKLEEVTEFDKVLNIDIPTLREYLLYNTTIPSHHSY